MEVKGYGREGKEGESGEGRRKKVRRTQASIDAHHVRNVCGVQQAFVLPPVKSKRYQPYDVRVDKVLGILPEGIYQTSRLRLL